MFSQSEEKIEGKTVEIEEEYNPTGEIKKVVCPECGKPTRIKHSVVDGKNVRVCKCGAVLDKKFEKASKKKSAPKAKKSADAKETETKSTARKTKLEKTEKTTKATASKNKAESANVKRKQDM